MAEKVFTLPRPLQFTADDFHEANDEWGANCGPGAIAGMLGIPLDVLRPMLGDFEEKRYTNPTLMLQTLARCKADNWVRSIRLCASNKWWPEYGLARIQWEGPWTRPGVPPAAAYRHTHWVGAITLPWPLPPNAAHPIGIFDINAISSGGWTTLPCWSDILVPALLADCEPEADGRWHITHTIELVL